MNNRQAQEILLRRRPGGVDDHDPEVKAALELAARDPELAEWLKNHEALQHAIQQRFRQTPIPAGLKEQILSEKPSREAAWRLPRRLAVGALATLLILFGVIYLTPRNNGDDTGFDNFRMRMVKTALRGYAMDVATTNETEISSYLSEQDAPANWRVSPGLNEMPLLGCATLKWQNHPVTLICYGDKPEPELWLFIVDNSSLPDPPDGSDQVVAEVNRLNTVSWTNAGRTYLLAGKTDTSQLLKLLKGKI